MYVCMSVCYEFMIEIYEFTYSLRTSLACAAHDAIVMEIEVEDSEDRRQRQTSPDVWKMINCSTKIR